MKRVVSLVGISNRLVTDSNEIDFTMRFLSYGAFHPSDLFLKHCYLCSYFINLGFTRRAAVSVVSWNC